MVSKHGGQQSSEFQKLTPLLVSCRPLLVFCGPGAEARPLLVVESESSDADTVRRRRERRQRAPDAVSRSKTKCRWSRKEIAGPKPSRAMTALAAFVSFCTPMSWILILCFLLSTMQPHPFVSAARVDGAIQRAATRRPSFSHRELLQFNSSRGLSQDETILLSWKSSSTYLIANWRQNDERYRNLGPCGWPRVGCGEWRGENRVTVLDLASVSLTGAIPAQISSLSALTSLSLASNNLTGTIPPEIGSCINLKELNFTNNKLTGNISVDIGRLGHLQRLDLSRNLLTGAIPPALFTNCTNLVYWNVSSNRLTGHLPKELATCRNLRTVDVGNNSLTGEIPPPMGQLPFLEELVMGEHNGFNGSIPNALFSNCQNLKTLDIAWNEFSGLLPRKLGNCSNLEILFMQGNHFSGPIPDDFGKLKKLKILALGKNMLTETLPGSLNNCTSLELLDVANNQLTGPVPTWLGKLPNLQFITFQTNRLFGTVPVEVTALSMLRYLDLSGNSLHGNVPPEFGRVASLRMLRLSGNNLTGTIPAELGNITNLQGLDISSNRLHGPIPSSFGNLRDLLWLQLENNTLTGTIPPELTNCSSLMWINLGTNELEGSIPADFTTLGWDSGRVFRQNQENPWIRDGSVGDCFAVSTWKPAQSQRFNTLSSMTRTCPSWLPLLVRGGVDGPATLRSNNFNGESKVLSYWLLENNKLSGPMPNFNHNHSTSTLGFLTLAENRLTGPIPPELGNLPIYHLNVSGNYLNGSIPAALGNASLLVTLDMAYNGLSGTLPPELCYLYDLIVLNVSYNTQLSGAIPTKGQFTTFGWDSYVGDVNLCFDNTDRMLENLVEHKNIDVPPLCSEVRSNPSPDSQPANSAEVNSDVDVISIPGFVLGAGLGFFGMCRVFQVYCLPPTLSRRRAAKVRRERAVWRPPT